MKKIFTVFCMLFLIGSLKTFAQKVLGEGLLVYNISIESRNGEKSLPGSLNGAVLSVYLSKDKSRTEMTSAPGTEATVFDTKADKGFILKEYSGQKLMITLTGENWAEKNRTNRNLKFSSDNEMVTINGYSCKKATATAEDGKTYTVYYDPSVTITNRTYNNAFPQLPGLPVQYELQQGNLGFRYTLVKYNSEIIAANKFAAPGSGFRIMTYEENRQLKKGE
jgi:GLPGLI family protein